MRLRRISVVVLLALICASTASAWWPWSKNAKRFLTTSTCPSGGWTAPANVYQAYLSGTGGGAAGNAQSVFSSPGYGGSAGEWSNKTAVNVVPGTCYSVTIGAAGLGQYGALGTAGGNTTFGSLFTLHGGTKSGQISYGGGALGNKVFVTYCGVSTFPACQETICAGSGGSNFAANSENGYDGCPSAQFVGGKGGICVQPDGSAFGCGSSDSPAGGGAGGGGAGRYGSGGPRRCGCSRGSNVRPAGASTSGSGT